jgi:hypothetical protein
MSLQGPVLEDASMADVELLSKATRKLLASGAKPRHQMRAVIEKYPVLFSPEAGEFFELMVESAKERKFDHVLCWTYIRDLVQRCAAEGVAVVFEATGEAAGALDLEAFLHRATSTRKARWAIKRAKHLMLEESIAELERMIEIAAELDDRRAFGWWHLPWLLRACREFGFEATLPMKLFEPNVGAVQHRRREMRALRKKTHEAMAALRATGESGLLDQVIEEHFAAIEDPRLEQEDGDVQAAVLSNAAMLITLRGDLTGSLDDYRSATMVGERAVALAAEGSQAYLFATRNRAAALGVLADRTGDPDIIEEAFSGAAVAVAATERHPWKAYQPRASLAVALMARFAATGEVTDMRAAQEAAQEGLLMTAPWEADWPRMVMLTATLRFRYADAFGDIGAWDEVIGELRLVEQLIPRASPDFLQLLTLLGGALAGRYLRLKNPADAEDSISCLELAIANFPSGVMAGAARMNLADTFATRYAQEGSRADLDRAIELRAAALAELSAHPAVLPRLVMGLGEALIDRYDDFGEPDDLQQGLAALREALAVSTDPVVIAGAHSELARGLALDPGVPPAEIEDHYRTACVQGLRTSLKISIRAARLWSDWAFDRGSWAEVAEAGRYGLEAAALLVRSQHARGHQENWLREVKGLPALGAYALVELGDPQGAVLLLEHGRTVLLSDLLDLDRRQAERVRDLGRPDLYERLTQALDHLQLQSARSFDAGDAALGQRQVETPREARAEFDQVVAEIRELPGQADFLRPVSFADVLAAAGPAPLVYPVITRRGGVALVVGAGPEVVVCALPGLSEQAVLDQINEAFSDDDDDDEGLEGFGRAMETVCGWLWPMMMAPLLAVVPGVRRLVVVPGIFTQLLPLHAAWIPDPARPSGRRYVLDEVTLSYAPSAKTLLARTGNTSAGSAGALIIAEPAPVSAASLPHTAHETAAVARVFPGSRTISGRSATRAAVIGELDRHSVVHFAGHAVAMTQSPLDSGLLLADDQMLTLRDIFRLRLTIPRLAVLSACETAYTGTELPDEASSLPSGLLTAGVSGVVASLWPVFDDAAALLVRRFYTLLTAAGTTGLDPAESLRQAQCWLRDATAGELAEAFPDVPALAPPPASAGAAAHAFWSTARPYADPLTWAAFTYTGASDLDL